MAIFRTEPFIYAGSFCFYFIIDNLVVQNPSLLPTDVLNLLATNRKTYDYILHNFPDSLIAKSIRQEKALHYTVKLYRQNRKTCPLSKNTTL